MQGMVVRKHRSAVEAWGPVSPAPAPPSPPGRPRSSHSQPHVVYRFSPAPYAVKQEIRRLTRPKSTPAQLARVSEENFFIERPLTANYEGCDRLDQLEHEPTRKHNFEVHLPVRKAKSASVTRSGDSVPVPYHNVNGFEFAKSREKIEVKIRTEDFFNRPESEGRPARKPTLDPAIEALITQLQEQVNDLTVYLEEERLNHRDTIKRADEILREKMAAVVQQHEDEIKSMKELNQTSLAEQSEKYENLLINQEKELTAQIDKLKGEIEFLQSAFESFKTSLHTETAEKLKQREEEMTNQHEEELENKLLDLRSKLVTESTVEKNNLIKDHAKKVERLEMDHTREVESLTQKFAKNSLELERLTGIQKQYEETRRDHQQLTKKHKELADNLSAVATELSDSKIQLLEFEASFHNRVQQVDERYKSEIHNLMSENTELRRSYMRKCAELYDEKVKYERMIQEKDFLLKEAMEKTAEVAVPKPAPDFDDGDDFHEIYRRYSFPLTSSENRVVADEIRPLSSFAKENKGRRESKNEESEANGDDGVVESESIGENVKNGAEIEDANSDDGLDDSEPET